MAGLRSAHILLALFTFIALVMGKHGVASTTYTGDLSSLTEPIGFPTPNTNVSVKYDGNLNCYDSCYGVTRLHSTQGIDWFCKQFDGWRFATSADYADGHWYYPASDDLQVPGGYHDEGAIEIKVSVIGDCNGVTNIMTYDSCRYELRIPLDNCNTDGVDGKQGGFLDLGCMRYDFQPNPLYWPECNAAHCGFSDDCSVGPPKPKYARATGV